MICIELWSGDSTGLQGARRWAYENQEDLEIITVDINPEFDPTIEDDIINVTADQLRDLCKGERPFMIWASPDCSVFSGAGFAAGHFRTERGHYIPNTPKAMEMVERHKHTIALIEALDPVYFVIENPVGLLRMMPWMQQFHRDTVTYCQYGDDRMKPTDLWGGFPMNWAAKPRCSPNDRCHTPSPRGSQDGTQGLSHRERSHIPVQLSIAMWKAAIESDGYRRQDLREWLS